MIVWDDGTKKQRIYEMWQDNFHDPVSYADFYFKEVYGKNEVLINQEEDVAKGMLHLNPYLLHVNEQPVRAKYIVGVATDKEYRRQGVMKELLIESFQILRSRGECFTYLMPADENYYLPFDFRFGMTQIEQEVEYLPDLYIPEEREAENLQKKTGTIFLQLSFLKNIFRTPHSARSNFCFTKFLIRNIQFPQSQNPQS